MTFVEQLDRTISRNHSLLCVGLDPDLSRLSPTFLKTDDPLFSFNKAIIDATKELVCAYKPNSAFYEMHGLVGLAALLKTIEYLHRETNVPVILDAKRGDVGHSSAAYAKAAFEAFKADAVTVNPYLGHDSVKPFLDHQDKGVFILCLTSNPGAEDFEADLYKKVAAKAKEWNKHGNIGLVVGATKPAELKEIVKVSGEMPLLVPGVGAQGGDLEAVVKFGGQRPIINASRSIIYAANPASEAKKLKEEINKHRS